MTGDSTAPAVIVRSFGYLHRQAPEADLTIDLRRCLHNPHRDPAMRDLTGHHVRVREHVLATPGADGLLHGAQVTATGLLHAVAGRGRQVVICWGCAGGRHRSVALAEVCAERLRRAGWGVELEHLDVGQPVVQ